MPTPTENAIAALNQFEEADAEADDERVQRIKLWREVRCAEVTQWLEDINVAAKTPSRRKRSVDREESDFHVEFFFGSGPAGRLPGREQMSVWHGAKMTFDPQFNGRIAIAFWPFRMDDEPNAVAIRETLDPADIDEAYVGTILRVFLVWAFKTAYPDPSSDSDLHRIATAMTTAYPESANE